MRGRSALAAAVLVSLMAVGVAESLGPEGSGHGGLPAVTGLAQEGDRILVHLSFYAADGTLLFSTDPGRREDLEAAAARSASPFLVPPSEPLPMLVVGNHSAHLLWNGSLQELGLEVESAVNCCANCILTACCSDCNPKEQSVCECGLLFAICECL